MHRMNECKIVGKCSKTQVRSKCEANTRHKCEAKTQMHNTNDSIQNGHRCQFCQTHKCEANAKQMRSKYTNAQSKMLKSTDANLPNAQRHKCEANAKQLHKCSTQSSQYKMLKCTMHKCKSHVQMHKLEFADAQVYKCSMQDAQPIAQMFKCTNAQKFKYTNAQMLKCSNAQKSKCSNVRMPNAQWPIPIQFDTSFSWEDWSLV